MKRLQNIRHLALDLDGTLYLGGRLFDFTLPFLDRIGRLGIGRTFFTNNSSRSTAEYVEKLNRLGFGVVERDLFTSTHCTFDYLRDKHRDARRVFVLGTPSLQSEFAGQGYVLSGETPDDEPELVIVGFDTTLAYERLGRAAWWISKGKPFIATHPDRTCPTDLPTVLPDCGAICKALSHATGREPDAVMGKPNARMLAGVLARHHLKADEVAVIGDRLHTDMEMAHSAGAVSVLVLSGESTRRQAREASPAPDFVVENVGEFGELLERAKKAGPR